MESYDVFLIGNFIALPAFANKYGVFDQAENKNVIVPKWQSALQMAGQLGALIGVFLAGPLTSRIGYRYATLTGLMALNAFIFIFYFAHSLPVMFVAQLLEGLPWGIFIANAPAYCSEIVPIKLRAPATQMLQMFWAIGSIIVGAVTYHYNARLDANAYRCVPLHFLKKNPTHVIISGFRLHCNGCSQLPSPSSSSARPNHPGGSSAKAVSSKPQDQSSDWDASHG